MVAMKTPQQGWPEVITKMDWEQWLRQAVKRPSDYEDNKRERTEDQIRKALRAHAPLRGRDFVVYSKGSYANNTNVRLDYDLDIAVEYRGHFYYDLEFDLRGQPASSVGIPPAKDLYPPAEFKRDIQNALEAAFGKTAVKPGNIAYRVRERKTTLPADVVPCWEYRRYDGVKAGEPYYHQGSRVFPT